MNFQKTIQGKDILLFKTIFFYKTILKASRVISNWQKELLALQKQDFKNKTKKRVTNAAMNKKP